MRLTTPSALLAVTVLAATAAPARAQTTPADPPAVPPALADKSLEDLMSVEVGTVFGAARREQRVTEAPSSVTIVTAEDIRTFGWRTLAEVLGSVRGFYVTNDRNYTYVGVRGFGRPSDYNNRVLVLVNGHRYNDNVYDQALIGNEFPVDLALVEQPDLEARQVGCSAEPDAARLTVGGHDVHVTEAGQLAGTPDEHGDDACLRVDLELACAGRHRGPR